MVTKVCCPHCGKELYQLQEYDSQTRYYCEDCGWVNYPTVYVSYNEYLVSLN
jgi:transposase-like protein